MDRICLSRWIAWVFVFAVAQLATEQSAYGQALAPLRFAQPAQADVAGKTPECLKLLVNIELSFIKRACEPSDVQMKAIVAEAKVAFKAMSDMIVNNQRGFMIGEGTFRGPNQELFDENPYVRVRKDAARYLKPLVSEKQHKKYVEEAKARDQFERSTAIDISLDLVDDLLLLTSDQRRMVYDKLMKDWTTIDFQILQMYLSNPQYMPSFPIDSFKKILEKPQIRLLTEASKRRISFNVTLRNEAQDEKGEEWIQ